MNKITKKYIRQTAFVLLQAVFVLLLAASVFLLFPHRIHAEQIKQNENYKYCYNKKYKGIEILSYRGSDTFVRVPDTIDGRPVTVIGKDAF